jgi:diaminopimelate decarboxylase
VYFVDDMVAEARRVRDTFGGQFEISFAVKSNPNVQLLRALRPAVNGMDASSIGEVGRALEADCAAADISFSGPAKRPFELEGAVSVGCGQIVCESLPEIRVLNALAAAAGRQMRILLRINPVRVPAKFGVNMAGKASQFGIDEEAVEDVLEARHMSPSLDLAGFHVYSGSNSLHEEAIAENFQIFAGLFQRFSDSAGIRAQQLVFGSGFGIPYHDGQRPLSLESVARRVQPIIDGLRRHPSTGSARLILEMGRFIVGPHGYFLTRVLNVKTSRGKYLCMCDGGFNNHLAACGLMGSVMRRNYPMWNVTPGTNAPRRIHQIMGPLCTPIDTLGTDVELVELRPDSVLAVGSSGAYGLSASPVNFISHPPPREFLISGAQSSPIDITERPSLARAGHDSTPEVTACDR